MRSRRAILGPDNLEAHGRLVAQGMDESGEIVIDTNWNSPPQFGMVVPNQPYLRNPYWFGNSMTINKLVPLTSRSKNKYALEHPSYKNKQVVSAFSHFLICACPGTLNDKTWKLINTGTEPEVLDCVEFSFTMYEDSKREFYLIESDEPIYGDVYAVLTGSILRLVDNKIELMGLDKATQPLVFCGESCELLDISQYDYYIEDGNSIFEFKDGVDCSNMIIVLIRSEPVKFDIKYPSAEWTNAGLPVTYSNNPYQCVELVYRVR